MNEDKQYPQDQQYWIGADQMHMLKTTRTAPLARTDDPATSKAAAEKCHEFKARHIAIIWASLKDNGPMIPAEIARATGLDYHAIQRRGAEMESAERRLITRGPEVRYGQRVWKAA